MISSYPSSTIARSLLTRHILRSVLPAIETRLRANDLKIAKFFDDVRAKYVNQRRIEEIDPGGLSFFNVNTEDDLTRARMLVGEGAKQ